MANRLGRYAGDANGCWFYLDSGEDEKYQHPALNVELQLRLAVSLSGNSQNVSPRETQVIQTAQLRFDREREQRRDEGKDKEAKGRLERVTDRIGVKQEDTDVMDGEDCNSVRQMEGRRYR